MGTYLTSSGGLGRNDKGSGAIDFAGSSEGRALFIPIE